MGDRGNIVVLTSQYTDKPPVPVYLYTHWHGYAMPDTIQRALARRERWGDDGYLARILFCEMLSEAHSPPENDALKAETGFAISGRMGDNEYPVFVIDPAHLRVHLLNEDLADSESIVANLGDREVNGLHFKDAAKEGVLRRLFS